MYTIYNLNKLVLRDFTGNIASAIILEGGTEMRNTDSQYEPSQMSKNTMDTL